MTKLQFPKHVPYLKPKHIYKGWYTGPNSTHCLAGWANTTFYDPETLRRVKQLLASEIDEKAAADTTNMSENVIVKFNDASTTNPQRICNVWNRAMKKLGYTEKV